MRVHDHGTIILFAPESSVEQVWMDENVNSEPWQWLGGALAVDHRYAASLIEGMESEGVL